MSLMPNYLLREWTNDGKLASGGFLYFYNSLTLTPKTVYSDATLTTPLTNPVQLDASGSAVIFMGPGAYRIWLKDKDGAQIAPWVDGVIGDGNSGSGINSNATFSTVKIYQDLRDLTVPTDFVYVAGRTMVGDGGAGIFQRIPTPTTDDDGIILNQASGSISYKRVFDSFIDPQWFGVKYLTVIDNTSLWDRVTAASVLYNCSIVVTGGIYINQNITIPSYSNIIFNDDGYFYSTLATTITFVQGSNMTSEGIAFGLNVSPKFDLNTVDSIKLSWMGGTATDDKWTKFINSPYNTRVSLTVDIDLSVTLTTVYSVNPISFINRSIITFIGTSLDITMQGLVADFQQIFYFPNLTSGVFNFGPQFVKPEIFGAPGVISYNAWKEVYCALRTGKCYLTTGKSYSVQTTLPSLPTDIEINGGGTLQLTNGVTLNTKNLTIRDISITTPTAVSWASVTYLELFNCVIPSLYTAGTQITDGVTYSDKSTNPSYNGSPSLYNAYLPLITSAEALTTDNTGKIIGSYGIREFNAEYNLRAINAQGTGFSARVRNFFETPTLICFANGTMGYWYRSKTDVNGLWVYNSSVTISTTGGSQKSILYMNYNSGYWYAATQSSDGANWHYEMFYATDPSSTWTACPGDGTHYSGQYPQGWNNCVRNSLTGAVYLSYGMDNVMADSAIVKVTGISAIDQNAGYGREYAKIIGMDEVNDYLYINSYSLPGTITDGIISRKKMSTNAEQAYSYNTSINCMAYLTGYDYWIMALAGGYVALGYNFLATTFAPTIGVIPNPNMGNIATMVNAQYSITAGGDTGTLGVSQSTPQTRLFSRRLSGMEGATYNSTAFGMTASYYLTTTREVLIGGSGGAVYSSVA